MDFIHTPHFSAHIPEGVTEDYFFYKPLMKALRDFVDHQLYGVDFAYRHRLIHYIRVVHISFQFTHPSGLSAYVC